MRAYACVQHVCVRLLYLFLSHAVGRAATLDSSSHAHSTAAHPYRAQMKCTCFPLGFGGGFRAPLYPEDVCHPSNSLCQSAGLEELRSTNCFGDGFSSAAAFCWSGPAVHSMGNSRCPKLLGQFCNVVSGQPHRDFMCAPRQFVFLPIISPLYLIILLFALLMFCSCACVCVCVSVYVCTSEWRLNLNFFMLSTSKTSNVTSSLSQSGSHSRTQ